LPASIQPAPDWMFSGPEASMLNLPSKSCPRG
jgi:hypothetical protein